MTQPPIADYAMIGNCHTAALVCRDGSVDWLCWPAFHDASWFARILDEDRGGHFAIRPTAPFEAERRYLPGTNVLRTTFRTGGGVVELDDMMPVTDYEQLHAEMRADQELLRIARCISGEVDLEVEVVPRPDYARARPRIRRRGALGIFFSHAADVLIVRSDPDVLEVDEESCRAHGTLRLRAGERAQVAVTFSREEPGIVPMLGEPADRRADQTVRWWRSWIGSSNYGGPYREAVERSLLALRLMLYAPSGGLIAAPTTSLPEQIDDGRNWDYRYCWLRDAALTVEALESLGYEDEGRAFVSWVLHTTRLSWPRVHPLYDVYGHWQTKERELPHLSGHRGSRPVRVGNGAGDQLQLDAYGELVCAAASSFLARDEPPDRATARMLRKLGGWICEHWNQPDAGIWEIRSDRRHHTFSVAMCWTTLDALIRMHDRFGLRVDRGRFDRTRRALREAIETDGWSDSSQSYKASFEEDRADGSLLLLSRYGYADPHDPRMRGTVARIRRDLERNALVWRYPRGTDDGLRGAEGAFGACSFWLVGALARQGDIHGACRNFERLLDVANDVGLYAEEVAPDGSPLGNFPQALTHIALIDAAITLDRATRGRETAPSGAREERASVEAA